MSQNIYSIQLLNDLHNHFPEILYGRPNRFRNVHDLIDYIRRVAQTSPYDRGFNQYISNDISRVNRPQWEIIADMPEEGIRLNGSSIISRVINELMGNVNNMDDLENVVIQPTAEQVANATNVYHVNSLQDDICTICQDNIESNEVRRITQCGHYFHRNCIDTWFQRNVQCPTCRHDIRN